METIVYHAAPGASLRAALRELRQRGLHPRALDDPGPTLSYASKGTYRVRIAVPREEAQLALEALRALEQHQAPGVARAAREFRRQVVAALGVGVVGTLALGLPRADAFGKTVPDVVTFLLVSIVGLTLAALLLIAVVARVRHALRAGDREGWRRWARALLMVNAFDAPFAEPEPPPAERRPRRKTRRRPH